VVATVNEDKLAIHIYRAAAGKSITLGTVDQHLDELRAHQSGCGCGLSADATVRPWASDGRQPAGQGDGIHPEKHGPRGTRGGSGPSQRLL
jgi:hypothetical protein